VTFVGILSELNNQIVCGTNFSIYPKILGSSYVLLLMKAKRLCAVEINVGASWIMGHEVA
jgi:hypothetical protein